jgi:hypothetical protein
MRKLSRLWQALERIPGLSTLPAYWEHHCGPDYPVIRPYLRITEISGSTYPCPTMRGGDCPRKIIDYGDGEIVAICRDPWVNCGDVPLTCVDTLLHELDIGRFTKDLAAPLGVRWQVPEPRGHGVWGIGLSNRRPSRYQPVFLAAVAFSEQLRAAVRDLLLDVPGPFVLAAPTNGHRDVRIQGQLQARGISFLSLEEQILLTGDGKFAGIDPLEITDQAPVTPSKDRQRVIDVFRVKYDCTVQAIADEAEVHIRDLYKWIAAQLKDSSKKSKRIEAVLRRGLPQRPRP